MRGKKTYREPGSTLPVAAICDVLVCGGGTSGVPAAIAAARSGAKTALIERYGFLGGVPAACLMPCWHRIGEAHSDLLAEFAARVGGVGPGPDALETGHMDPEYVKAAALEMTVEAGVDLHLHTMCVRPIVENAVVVGVITESKSGRRAFRSRVVVDATGDADIAARAGAPFAQGDDSAVTQGQTLRFTIGQIDFDRYFDWATKHPEYYPGVTVSRLARLRKRAREGRDFYLPADLSALYREHPEHADLPLMSYFNSSSIRPGELSVNATRTYGLDGAREEDLTRAEIECRKQALALWRFLREHVPGFEHSTITQTALQVGVRETRRVVGDYVLTELDCRRGTVFPDTVAVNPVSFDLHDRTYSLESLPGRACIPYRCLLPQGVEGLLVVGRCISTDHVANSTIRRMMTAFELGQAGGIAAALAARDGLTPRNLPYVTLRDAMRAAGCLPDLSKNVQ